MRAALLFAVALSLVGCGKPGGNADLSNAEPAFKMTAEEFHRQASSEKFKGKVIELSGTVRDVSRNAGGEAMVQLEVAGEMLGVACFTADEYPWAKVARGQKIRLKGQWAEVIMVPRLLSCVFVETGEYAAVRISATDLAKEYAADSEVTAKKYNKKHLVVTGEVEKKEVEFGAAGVFLKTGNKVKIECGFATFDKDLSSPISAGQTVSIFGDFSFNFGGDSIHLNSCLPMPAK